LKLSFARDIVCGMKYLHSLPEPVVHSDLKSKNVLISDRHVAKVSNGSWKLQPVGLGIYFMHVFPGFY